MHPSRLDSFVQQRDPGFKRATRNHPQTLCELREESFCLNPIGRGLNEHESGQGQHPSLRVIISYEFSFLKGLENEKEIEEAIEEFHNKCKCGFPRMAVMCQIMDSYTNLPYFDLNAIGTPEIKYPFVLSRDSKEGGSKFLLVRIPTSTKPCPGQQSELCWKLVWDEVKGKWVIQSNKFKNMKSDYNTPTYERCAHWEDLLNALIGWVRIPRLPRPQNRAVPNRPVVDTASFW